MNTISTIFGVFILVNGILNLFFGNDPILGLVFVFISSVYFNSTNELIKHQLNLTINPRVKLVLAVTAVWIVLAVGAVAEGFVF